MSTIVSAGLTASVQHADFFFFSVNKLQTQCLLPSALVLCELPVNRHIMTHAFAGLLGLLKTVD